MTAVEKTTRESVAQLTSLLDEQIGLLRQLHELIVAQKPLARGGDSRPLAELLTRREALIAAMLNNDSLIGALRARVGSDPGVAARVETIARLAVDAAAQDHRDIDAMGVQRDRVAAEIEGLAAGRRAAAAYGPGASTSPHYQDRKG